MTPPDSTARLLQQWLEMTRAESQAIQACAWAELHQIQSCKAALRQPLIESRLLWVSDGLAGRVSTAGVLPYRAEIARLIALESHNARLLAARRDKAREQQRRLERAAQNLRNVRRSYVPPPPPGACNSWS